MLRVADCRGNDAGIGFVWSTSNRPGDGENSEVAARARTGAACSNILGFACATARVDPSARPRDAAICLLMSLGSCGSGCVQAAYDVRDRIRAGLVVEHEGYALGEVVAGAELGGDL